MRKVLSKLCLLSAVCILVLSSFSFAETVPEGETDTFSHETWICPNCGKENNDAFCPWCGEQKPEPLPPIVCTGCGTEYSADTEYLFCMKCGTKLEKTLPLRKESFKVGNVVTFGHYEQDCDMSNGPEAIEWIVLDVQDGKALLLSRYGLDMKPHHTDYSDITWENCPLRDWLNGDFLNSVFSADEQAAILMTEVDNSSSQGYSGWSTNGGNNTQDKVFLLSYAEANRYLGVTRDDHKNTKARVKPTAYANENGAFTFDGFQTKEGDDAGRWWLRSPGGRQNCLAYVHGDGSLDYYVEFINGTVRPAFWLDLESDLF